MPEPIESKRGGGNVCHKAGTSATAANAHSVDGAQLRAPERETTSAVVVAGGGRSLVVGGGPVVVVRSMVVSSGEGVEPLTTSSRAGAGGWC